MLAGSAAHRTWANTYEWARHNTESSYIDDSTNWVQLKVPGGDDTALFDQANPTFQPEMRDNWFIGSIQVSNVSYALDDFEGVSITTVFLNDNLTATNGALFNFHVPVYLSATDAASVWDISADSIVTINGGTGRGDPLWGMLIGDGTLKKTGSGSLVIFDSSVEQTPFQGKLQINDGTVKLNGANALENATVDLESDNGLGLAVDNASLGALKGSGNLGLGSLTLNVGNNNQDTTYSGIISGTVNDSHLAKQGDGTLTLTGWTAATPSAFGSLQVRGAGVQVTGGFVHLTSGTQPDLDLGGDFSVTAGGDVSVAGETRFDSAATMLINNATLETDQLSCASGINAVIQLNDPSPGHALTVGIADGDSVFNGQITDAAGGSGSLYKTGTGTLTLNRNNTYSRGTLIDGGTLSLGRSSSAGTGAITIGGSATIAYASAIAVSNPIALQHDGTLNVDSGSATHSGVIDDAGMGYGITKAGDGTLVLSAANTFTGTTLISGGILQLAHADALQYSTVDLPLDNGLDITTNAVDANLGGLQGPGNLNTGAQTVKVGANNASTTYSGIISGTGSLLKTGTGTLILNAANTFSGTVTINHGAVQLSDTYALEHASIAIAANGTLQLAVDAAIPQFSGAGSVDLGAQTLTAGSNGASTTFSGVISGTGSLAKAGKGTLTLTGDNSYSGGTTIGDGMLVVGDGSTSGSVTGDVTNNGVLEFNRSDDLSFGGTISGTGSLTMAGKGMLTLGGANTFSNTTTISKGTIALGDANALENSAVSIGTNGVLQVNVDAAIVGFAGSGQVNLGSSTLTDGSGNADAASSARISGDAASQLTKTGAGTLTLTGGTNRQPSSFDQLHVTGGAVAIAGGHVILNSAGTSDKAIALFLNSGDVTVASGGDAQVAGTTYFLNNGRTLTVDGATLETDRLSQASGISGTVQLTDPAGGTALTVGINDGSSTFNGTIAGTGSLVKSGAGTLTLGGTSTYRGTTSILGGTLLLNNASALRHSPVSIGANGSLQLAADSAIVGLAGSGNVGLGAQTLTVGADDTSTAYSGVIGGTGSLTKAGNGILTLANANTFSGQATINSGVVQLNNANALADATVDVEVNNGLDVTTHAIDANLGALRGSAYLNLGLQTLTTGSNGATTTFFGVLTGGASSVLVQNGTGTLTLYGGSAGARSSFGSLHVTGGGAVRVAGHVDLFNTGGQTLFLNGGDLTVSSGADVSVAGATRFNTAQTLTIADSTLETDRLNEAAGVLGTIRLTDPTSSAHALTVGSNGGSSTFKGTIQDNPGLSGSLLKTGAGTFTLTGANTYSAGTFVDGGTLLADNITGSATGTGPITIRAGATLGGSGFVGGAVTVNSGGVISPGNSPGILTIHGQVALQPGASLVIQLAGLTPGTYDALNVASVTLNNALLDVSILAPFALAPGEQFAILDASGNLTGTFSGLNEGDLVSTYGHTGLYITYQGNGGHEIDLYTASVPEPATGALALVMLGLAGTTLTRRCNAPRTFSGTRAA